MSKLKDWYYVWQVSEQYGLIFVSCKECGHQAEIVAKNLPERLQILPVQKLSLICSSCRSKRINIMPGIFDVENLL